MTERKSFLLRVEKETLDCLQRWADDELRSLNGQIEYLLRDALRKAGRLKAPPGQAAPPGKAGESSAPSDDRE